MPSKKTPSRIRKSRRSRRQNVEGESSRAAKTPDIGSLEAQSPDQMTPTQQRLHEAKDSSSSSKKPTTDDQKQNDQEQNDQDKQDKRDEQDEQNEQNKQNEQNEQNELDPKQSEPEGTPKSGDANTNTVEKPRVTKPRALEDGSPSPTTAADCTDIELKDAAMPVSDVVPSAQLDPEAVQPTASSSDNVEVPVETQRVISMSADGKQRLVLIDESSAPFLDSPLLKLLQKSSDLQTLLSSPLKAAAFLQESLGQSSNSQALSPLASNARAKSPSRSPKTPQRSHKSTPLKQSIDLSEIEDSANGSFGADAGLHDNPEDETQYLKGPGGSDASPSPTPSNDKNYSTRLEREPEVQEMQIESSAGPVYDAEVGVHANEPLKQTSYFSHNDEALMLNVLKAVHDCASYSFIALVLQEIYNELNWHGFERYCSREDAVNDISDRRIGIKLAKLRNKNKDNDAYNLYSEDHKAWYSKVEKLAIERIRAQAPKKKPPPKEYPLVAGAPERMRYTQEEELMLRHWLIQGRNNKFIQSEYRNLRPQNAIKQKMQKLRKQYSSKQEGVNGPGAYKPCFVVTPNGHFDETKENFVAEGNYPESDYDAFLRRLNELDEFETSTGPKVRVTGNSRSPKDTPSKSVDLDIAMFDESPEPEAGLAQTLTEANSDEGSTGPAEEASSTPHEGAAIDENQSHIISGSSTAGAIQPEEANDLHTSDVNSDQVSDQAESHSITNERDSATEETPVPEEEAPIPEEEAPVPQEGAHLPQEGAPVPKEGAPVMSKGRKRRRILGVTF